MPTTSLSTLVERLVTGAVMAAKRLLGRRCTSVQWGRSGPGRGGYPGDPRGAARARAGLTGPWRGRIVQTDRPDRRGGTTMLGRDLGAPARERERRPARERLERGLFLAGLLALAFGYGVAVGKGLLFPHVLINNAVDAARDWRENWRQYLGLRSEFVLPSERTAGGVTRYDRAAWPGDTFLTMYHDHRFG